ncbi:MAG: hydrogenase maturation protease [Actinomycetota bacterium]
MTPSRTQPAPGIRAWGPGVAGASDDGASAASPVVIIGLGNDIASDDGVGIHAARRLEIEFSDRDDVDVVALPWAGFSLLDVLRCREQAVIIDSLVSGTRPPGSIVRLGMDDLSGSVRLNSFHDINYPTVMDLGRRLGWQMPDDVAIFGVETAVTDEFGEALTPAVAEAVTAVVQEVKQFIEAMDTSTDERVAEPL